MAKKSTKHSALRLFSTGFGMGTADLVPGVSGGTIAFLFGIYEELLFSIRTVTGTAPKLLLKGKLKEAWQSIPFTFLLPLFLGIGLAIFGLANLFSYLLENYAVFVWSFFFGLVIGSGLIIRKRIKHWTTGVFVALVLSTILTYFVVGLAELSFGSGPLALFFTGAIAFCAMILPGISGSLMLVIMGQYEAVLNAVSDRDFLLLGVLAAGGIVGLALFARLLGWLFRKYHAIVIAALIGMLIGSLRKVWPWREPVEGTAATGAHTVEHAVLPAFDWRFLVCVLLAIVAVFIVIKLEKAGITKEHTEDIPDKEFKKEHREGEKTS